MSTVAPAELVERIWARDATLWTGSDEAKWLGWLDEPMRMRGRTADLLRFALELEILRFEIHLHGFEAGLVVFGGAQRLALRQKEIACKTVLDADCFAHLAELCDTFE